MTPYERQMCPDCRYPMLKLRHFEGISSRDAPNFDRRDPRDFHLWGWWVWQEFLEGRRQAKRRHQARRLRKQILLDYPFSVICPYCFHIEKRDGNLELNHEEASRL